MSILEQLANFKPVLRSTYDNEVAYWHPEVLPATVLSAALANALATSVETFSCEELAAIFACCEAVLISGGAEDAAAIATGFLEALQHADGRNDFDFSLIANHLGTNAKAHCLGMDEFYGTSTRGL